MSSEERPGRRSAASAGSAVAKSGFAWGRWCGSFVLTLAVVAAMAGGFLFGIAQLNTARALPGVSVGGIPVGSTERAAAEARLRSQLPSLSDGQVVLTQGDLRVALPYVQLGRDYDYGRMLDQALAFGRSGTSLEVALNEIHTLARGHEVGPLVRYDRSAVEAAVGSIVPRFEVVPTDAVVRSAPDGTFTVVPAVEGRQVDRAVLVDAIVRAIATADPADTTVRVTVTAVEPAITTAEAQAALSIAESMTSSDLTLATPDGKGAYTVPTATLRTWVAFFATPDGGYLPTVVTVAARSAVERLAPKVEKAPKDAQFLIGTTGVVGVLAGVNGRTLDVEATLKGIEANLLSRTRGSPVPSASLATMPVPPRVSTDEAKKTAPLMKMISSWTTRYEVSERNFWSKNITIPALKLNGYVIQPGGVLDFWDAIGEVSTRTGYGPGGAILNGKTRPTGALAGGICSTSTTLFNAAVRAGLEIIKRYNHYYYISRYPVGLDATVSKTDGGGGQDLIFRNDTPYPILIRAIAKPGVVTFQFYSVPDGRTTTFSKPIVTNYARASDSVEYTSALPPGVKKRIEIPTDGFNSQVTRIVRDNNGKIIHRETFYSHYARVTGVLQIGKQPEAPPTDAPTTPAPGSGPTPTADPIPPAGG